MEDRDRVAYVPIGIRVWLQIPYTVQVAVMVRLRVKATIRICVRLMMRCSVMECLGCNEFPLLSFGLGLDTCKNSSLPLSHFLAGTFAI